MISFSFLLFLVILYILFCSIYEPNKIILEKKLYIINNIDMFYFIFFIKLDIFYLYCTNHILYEHLYNK
jgi:hypothetical protein